MAQGTVTKIQENAQHLLVEVGVAGAVYVVIVALSEFNALPTAQAKQDFIISAISAARRAGRQYENTFAAFVGTVVTIPD